MITLRIVTFNIWALPLPVPGDDRPRRMAALPAALRELDADIFALQEAFPPAVRRDLVAAFRGTHRTTGDALQTRRMLGLVGADATGGLLLLSRFPIVEHGFLRHPLPRPAKWTERLAAKGALTATVRTGAGDVRVCVFHLYAGRKPEDHDTRLAQLDPLLRRLPDDTPCILAGDLNASPRRGAEAGRSVSPEYQALARAGFRDAASDPQASGLRTYAVPRNKYAALWFNQSRSAERFDYVFYRAGKGQRITAVDARRVFDDPQHPLSDHYGFVADLRIE